MKFKIIWIVLLTLLTGGLAAGQTAAEYERKYGAKKYYQIRAQVLMRPQFDQSGRVCLVKLVPNHYPNLLIPDLPLKDERDPGDVHLIDDPFSRPVYSAYDPEHLSPSRAIEAKILKEVLDELAPPGERQGKGDFSVDLSGFGGSYTSIFRYQNVTFSAAVLITKKPGKVIIGQAPNNINSFFEPPWGEITSARIRWNDRTCRRTD